MKKSKPDKNADLIKHLTFEPLTRDNWKQFVQLFGERGACAHCWCMSFRLQKKEFEAGKVNDGNKNAMHKLVQENKPAGVLGFYQGEAIAWCALAPREDFTRLETSRVHKSIDDKPVWSIPCFFIDKRFRRKGLSVAMLKGVIAYAKENRIKTLEAYPTIPTKGMLPDAFAWIGIYKSFKRAGFTIVDRTSKHRPMVRYDTSKS